MFEHITQDVGTVVLSNLDAAYRLARWHFRTEHEAESVVRDASEKAFRECSTFSAGTGRVWFLRMVSRLCAERNARRGGFDAITGEWHGGNGSHGGSHLPGNNDVTQLEEAIRSLPPNLREVLVLRELEGLSYRELADLLDVPMETVTVMLSHSRQALGHALTEVLVAGAS